MQPMLARLRGNVREAVVPASQRALQTAACLWSALFSGNGNVPVNPNPLIIQAVPLIIKSDAVYNEITRKSL